MLQEMQNRRSVRKYTDEKIPEDKLEKIVQAGLLSASSRALRPWEILVVEDKEVLAKLAVSRQNGAAGMLKGAGAAILVFGYKEKSDVWVEDCSIVMTHLHLMADSLGLGSCWIQGRNRMYSDDVTTDQFVRELVGTPEDLELEAILSVGVINAHPAARELNELAYEKVHKERF